MKTQPALDALPVANDAPRPDAAVPPPGGRPALPPGPPSPWLGFPLLRAMRADYLGFTAALRRDHGDIVRMRLVNERAYDLFSPELVRALLVDNAAHLVRWERGTEVFSESMGQSVLVTEGDRWQRQRRMLMPGFSPKRVAGYAGLMRSAAIDALETLMPAQQHEALVGMDVLFSRMAMDVILRTLFSARASQSHDTDDAIAAVQVLSETGMREMFMPMTLPDWLPLPGKAAKRRALRTLRGVISRHIEARRLLAADDAPKDDLLAMLLGLRDEESGQALSAAEVFDQCVTTFQAGHETTATTLLWWSWLMAEHPGAATRAREEVDAVLGGRQPEPEDMASLPWLTATLKEAMRLYPPAAGLMSRRAKSDLQVGEWVIPRGAMIRITPYVLHRDERSFADPDDFRPERFLPCAPPPPRGAWFPFGMGPRVCIAQHFAMLEMGLIASLMLQRFTLERPADARPPRPVLNVTLRPAEPIVLRLRRRTMPV